MTSRLYGRNIQPDNICIANSLTDSRAVSIILAGPVEYFPLLNKSSFWHLVIQSFRYKFYGYAIWLCIFKSPGIIPCPRGRRDLSINIFNHMTYVLLNSEKSKNDLL